MGEPGPLPDTSPPAPDIFFMPLAVPEPECFGGLDAGVLSRRLPHFLQLIVNRGGPLPAGMLEVQSPPDDGPARWVTLTQPVDPEEALELVPDEEAVRAVITGVLGCAGEMLDVELTVHFSQETWRREGLRARLARQDPVPGLRRLATLLSQVLGLPDLWPEPGMLTSRGDAFFKFLEGLDGAALLSSDLPDVATADGEKLMRPLSDALVLDPAFGLALRTAHVAVATALEGERLGEAACCRVFDRCFEASPGDGEGCVAVAEHLAVLGDDKRAQAWLEHATHLEPPPPRGLESLGILFANRGETIAARNLWLRGLELDGHPDFFAHLARLAFEEDQPDEAWDKVLRGLRRIYERSVRSGEWRDEDRGPGVLLRYLVEHLQEVEAPAEVGEALADLAGCLTEGEDRVDLGLCLLAVGDAETARSELCAGLGRELEPEIRDQGVRALLALQVPEFERKFAHAVDTVIGSRDPRPALPELRHYLELQPAFWPALFFLGIAERRMTQDDRAIDTMAEVLRLRPGQPDALAEMAELFAERGNPKRALECVEQALEERASDARLLAARAEYLWRLGRRDEALTCVAQAVEADPKEPEWRRLQRRMRRDLEARARGG